MDKENATTNIAKTAIDVFLERYNYGEVADIMHEVRQISIANCAIPVDDIFVNMVHGEVYNTFKHLYDSGNVIDLIAMSSAATHTVGMLSAYFIRTVFNSKYAGNAPSLSYIYGISAESIESVGEEERRRISALYPRLMVYMDTLMTVAETLAEAVEIISRTWRTK